ncbi:hypothetical protein niasHT_012673 [Heterodera trifolii]|uniref:Uncharacterized protein n=1 Tax=Heterodera trifolii TaxID=157864 RepID=A0ABD2L1R4_9BILA
MKGTGRRTFALRPSAQLRKDDDPTTKTKTEWGRWGRAVDRVRFYRGGVGGGEGNNHNPRPPLQNTTQRGATDNGGTDGRGRRECSAPNSRKRKKQWGEGEQGDKEGWERQK